VSLNISESAMPGTYTVTGYVGEYPNIIEDFDSFTFVKEASGDWEASEAGTVTISGWGETETVALKGSSMPQETRLLGHYPEPFNPTAAISYELRAASFVSLQVYDTAGRLIMTLVNGMMPPGVYREVFDGHGLASGIYVYRLQAGDYSASGKMVLMK